MPMLQIPEMCIVSDSPFLYKSLGTDDNISYHYPTALRRVQITPKTSTNIARYLYSRAPVRQVFSQHASEELD